MSHSINNLQYLTLCVSAEILGIIGVTINAFIVTVNLIDWIKKKTMTHVEQIITVLGMTRICSQTASFLYILLGVFFHNQNSSLRLYIIKKVDYFFSYSSTWLMTLLSIVYCLKISNFHNVFLLRLKIIISQKVGHLVAASGLISFSYVLLVSWIEHLDFSKFMTHNMTSDGTKSYQRNLILLVIFLVCNSVPFILYCTSSVVVIASLTFHLYGMSLNKTPTKNLDTYYNVIKFMTLSLIYFILSGTACVVVIYSHSFYSLDIIWVYITIDTFPNLHSMYLIQRTNKLRDTFCRILQRGTNCLLNRRNEDPSFPDPVEIIMK